MTIGTAYQTFKRYRTLQTSRVSSLPIVILMPHSACNCRCVMCDIWKGNRNLRQLTGEDVDGLMGALKKYGTRQVVMSGGEALLNPNFFRLCGILKREKIKICLLSTGLTIGKNAEQLANWVDEIIVSLDGNEALHDAIRNVPGAFRKMKNGIETLRSITPEFPVSGRTVIHRLNFRCWSHIIDSAKEIGLDRISFLPADVSSSAFNREMPWDQQRQLEILLSEADLPELQALIDGIVTNYAADIKSRFIAEPAAKLQMIHDYYAACYGHNAFPYKKCNAPWVSTVIEADGAVRPCFFHNAYGNIRSHSLDTIVNSDAAIAFRRNLDMDRNETCLKCVCYLNLSPFKSLD